MNIGPPPPSCQKIAALLPFYGSYHHYTPLSYTFQYKISLFCILSTTKVVVIFPYPSRYSKKHELTASMLAGWFARPSRCTQTNTINTGFCAECLNHARPSRCTQNNTLAIGRCNCAYSARPSRCAQNNTLSLAFPSVPLVLARKIMSREIFEAKTKPRAISEAKAKLFSSYPAALCSSSPLRDRYAQKTLRSLTFVAVPPCRAYIVVPIEL